MDQEVRGFCCIAAWHQSNMSGKTRRQKEANSWYRSNKLNISVI